MRLLPVLALLLAALPAEAQSRPRARDLGIDLGGTPGSHNAITDVAGVEVGHATIIRGEGRLEVGRGPVRTGVTAIWPRGRGNMDGVFSAWHTLNGNGEMTGTTWVEESGLYNGPLAITNTHSVGVVRDALVEMVIRYAPDELFGLPLVAETYDGLLSDINGFHVRREHALAALDSARPGSVAEGNVGGGTGMICHQFKGGIGTSSRVLDVDYGGYTVGVLVQCNYGSRRRFAVAGVPVGREITGLQLCRAGDSEPARTWLQRARKCAEDGAAAWPADVPEGLGSIIVIVATDAPLLPHQLKRITERVPLAIGRMGGLGEDSSGDIFLAFSTQPVRPGEDGRAPVTMLDNPRMNPLFEATVEATEEAILNAMLAAETMTGADGIRVHALPADQLVAAMRKYGRLP